MAAEPAGELTGAGVEGVGAGPMAGWAQADRLVVPSLLPHALPLAGVVGLAWGWGAAGHAGEAADAGQVLQVLHPPRLDARGEGSLAPRGRAFGAEGCSWCIIYVTSARRLAWVQSSVPLPS